jgi:hypothetical protein
MGPRPGMPAGFPMGGPGGFDIGNYSSKSCIFCSASRSGSYFMVFLSWRPAKIVAKLAIEIYGTRYINSLKSLKSKFEII